MLGDRIPILKFPVHGINRNHGILDEYLTGTSSVSGSRADDQWIRFGGLDPCCLIRHRDRFTSRYLKQDPERRKMNSLRVRLNDMKFAVI
jgi:hypothetical protein